MQSFNGNEAMSERCQTFNRRLKEVTWPGALNDALVHAGEKIKQVDMS